MTQRKPRRPSSTATAAAPPAAVAAEEGERLRRLKEKYARCVFGGVFWGWV